jgi:hypothetical protein
MPLETKKSALDILSGKKKVKIIKNIILGDDEGEDS